MSRGYHNYRGRRSPEKTVLTVILVAIILASVGFIFLQESIISFDETGNAYFRLPGRIEEEAEAPREEIDLTIEPAKQERPEPRKVRGFCVPTPPERESWSLSYREAKELLGEELGAVAVTLKDSEGTVHFDSAAALPGTVRFFEEDTDVVLSAVLDTPLHTIARISCFHDPKAANREAETMGLMNTGGFLFYDGNNSQWLDPAKPAARAYLCALAKEAAELGFDEILLTDVSYPTEGKLDKIDYGETMKAQNLRTFLEEMGRALEPYGVTLSIELPEAVVLEGSDNVAGLTLADIVPLVDRICAVTTAEKADQLRAAVEALSPETEFVPELTAPAAGWEGSSLILE